MGCVMSTAIAVLLCKHRCSIENLTSSMSFHPPSPASYTLETADDGSLNILFSHSELANALTYSYNRRVQCKLKLLRTSRRQSIPLFHFICEGATTTLLWSHANAMDCGEMYFFFLEFAERLNVNVAAYDYSGYGAATGVPTETNAYADALAVYNYLVSSGVDPATQLVLYGQSIGSAPTLYLATRRKCSCAAIVLHTPILSGLRFLIPEPPGFCTMQGFCSPRCVYAPCDPFPNFKRIRRVRAPVLLIHGTADATVHHSHTLQLQERVPASFQREPYIIEGAGHENIVDYDIATYFTRMHDFLLSISENHSTFATVTAPSRYGPPKPIPPVRGDGIDHRSVQVHSN
mmetsp:Transcript_43852/g.115239  ORF Transcript_43852/g.115239 Transcript_43852/m.115239 type:complete len:347 (-) Transcript_43852:272-1312(-)|eukprot:CAMPEP_0115861576 /NCGR_PEP_ID=MMETSP0287-20121206/17724_1 /TAXON_ID=412157 /ORGANISM="Chrysochromulina rotalis, Strain UIO044" /LENGTH=346 /DNA_ID=CAMNT_0003315955 /DNA_START=85 /DNA_END=1125 /DNA_ORIENTATION=-